jgi:hypothetical protein
LQKINLCCDIDIINNDENKLLIKKIRKIKSCITSLKVCLNAISTQNEVKPFLIFGLNPKNAALTITIATFGGYIYYAIFMLYVQAFTTSE